MNFIDFLIGMFLVNGMAHFVFGISNVRFLGLFGYGARGNTYYGITCVVISLILFAYSYGWASILEHGIIAGGFATFLVYLFLGKPLLKVFQKK